MQEPDLHPYESPRIHETVSDIIRDRSSNRADVRDVALGDLDLGSARRILDLGCGFGFLAERLVNRVAADAHFVGVDTWEADARPFQAAIVQAGRQAEFVCMQIEKELPWPDRRHSERELEGFRFAPDPYNGR